MGNKRAPILAGIGVAILALLLILFLVLPKMGEVGEAQDELSTAQGEEQTLLAQQIGRAHV